MNSEVVARELSSVIKGEIRCNEMMSSHTSWKVGGPADLFVIPESVRDIREIIIYCNRKDIPLTLIGNGSNILVLDGGIRGIVLKIGRGLDYIKIQGNRLICGAGASIPRLVRQAAANGIAGLEFMVGIPASVGGAVVMNAGAHGSNIGDYIKEVKVLDLSGEMFCFGCEELRFSYRSSIFREKKMVLLEATLEGKSGIPGDSVKLIEHFLALRKDRQPLNFPNAGSVFKNPSGKNAGRLIDLAGAKGMRIGDAQVSEKHANFIVNLGSAKAEDILKLIEKVRTLVKEKFNVELALEVQVLGETKNRR